MNTWDNDENEERGRVILISKESTILNIYLYKNIALTNRNRNAYT